jgi:hypothetical protein
MGTAYSAVADDASSVFWNPAGLSFLRRAEADFSYNSWFVDTTINDLSFALPFSWGGAGLRATYVNYGSFEVRDSNGVLQPQSEQPTALGLSAGLAVDFGILSVGAALKVSQETFFHETQTQPGLDFGLMAPVDPFRFALGFRNLDLSNPAGVFPSVFSGASFRHEFDRNQLLVSADGDFDERGLKDLSQGAEFIYQDVLVLRAGIRWSVGGKYSGDDTYLSGGLGVHFGDLLLDYALSSFGALGTVNMATLSYQFGTVKENGNSKPNSAEQPHPQIEPATSPLTPRAGNAPEASVLTSGSAPSNPPQNPAVPPVEERARAFETEGDNAFNLKRYESAADAYQKAADLRPSARTYHFLGVCYFNLGKKELSISCMTKSLELQDNPQLREWLEKYRLK